MSDSVDSRQLRAELLRLLQPAVAGLLWTVERLHWWLLALVVAYLTSGVTIVQPDEVAVVYRFGALVGDGAGAVREPGVLVAMPRPIVRVVRVPTARVFETELRDLHFSQTDDKATRYLVTSRTTLDPERVGYVVTGDQNIVHVAMVARWQVADPIAWTQAVAEPEELLRAAVLASSVACSLSPITASDSGDTGSSGVSSIWISEASKPASPVSPPSSPPRPAAPPPVEIRSTSPPTTFIFSHSVASASCNTCSARH